MSGHRYLDLFLTEEDQMAKEMFRGFVEKEIMPVRQKIDEDTDHEIVNQILQGMTDLGIQKAAFPTEYGGGGSTSLVSDRAAAARPWSNLRSSGANWS